MICVFCKNEIDSDSYYCDQCGKEIKICPQCGQPGKGKVCTEHGKKLISAKERNDQQPAGTPVKTPGDNTQKIPEEEPNLVAPNSSQNKREPAPENGVPPLSLVNNAIQFNLAMQSGDIIGRKKGRFADKFFQYKQISGGHAKVEYDGNDWYITDLDSSNGTKYNGMKLGANLPQKLENNSRIILANIEFIVNIENTSENAGTEDPDKTIRL